MLGGEDDPGSSQSGGDYQNSEDNLGTKMEVGDDGLMIMMMRTRLGLQFHIIAIGIGHVMG